MNPFPSINWLWGQFSYVAAVEYDMMVAAGSFEKISGIIRIIKSDFYLCSAESAFMKVSESGQ